MSKSPIIYNSYPSNVKKETYDMLISAIEDRDKDESTKYKIALLCTVILIILEIAVVNYAFISIALLTLSVVLFGVIIRKSKEKKNNLAKYIFTDSRSVTLFEELRQHFLCLNEYTVLWCVPPSLNYSYCTVTEDNRSKIKIEVELTDLFNIDFPLLVFKYAKLGHDVYEYTILPDGILLKTKDEFKFYPFNELEVSINHVDLTEYHNGAPSDAQMVRTGWLHQRVSGGPDLRYKENPKVGIYRYYQIQFKHESHIVLSLLTSKVEGFDDLCLYFQELQNKIENLDKCIDLTDAQPIFSDLIEQPVIKKKKSLFFCSDCEDEHIKIFKDLNNHFGSSIILESNSKESFEEEKILDSDIFLCVLDHYGNNQIIANALKLAFDLNKDVFIVDPYNNQVYKDQIKRCRRSIYVLSDIEVYNRLFLDLYPVLGLLMPEHQTIIGHTLNLSIHSRNGFSVSVDGVEVQYEESNKNLMYCYNKGCHKFVISNSDRTVKYSNEFSFDSCTWKTEFRVKYDYMLNFDSFIQNRNFLD